MRSFFLALLAASAPLTSASAQNSETQAVSLPSVAFTALDVADLDKSLAFYHGVFGMAEKLRIEGAEEVEVGIDFPQAPSSPRILLVGRKDKVAQRSASGFNRIALLVTGIEKLCERATMHGGRILKPVADIRAHKVKIAFLADPDGHIVELIEPDH
jgi:Lactoylglutathione lyase and related lyases